MNNNPFQNPYDFSDRKYFEFIESLPVAIYRTTIEGKIVLCNRLFSVMLGFDSCEELVDYPDIKLYNNVKDRGYLISSALMLGRVVDLPVSFVKKDGTQIWCSVTAKTVFDDEETALFLDAVFREISGEIDDKHDGEKLDCVVDSMNDIIINFALNGEIIDINNSGSQMLGYLRNELIGKPLVDYVVQNQRDLFILFLSDILKIGKHEGILSIVDSSGMVHHLEFNTVLVKKNGKAQQIKGVARDVTERIRQQKERSLKEKLQGVQEMAGGVAHKLNQPLTVISNLLSEVLNSIPQDSMNFNKLEKVQKQIEKLNEITKKIASVKKYEVIDYVAGVRIVDIDKAS
ncbi:MAG: PAS domain S-box protein [Desulfobacteraceae bacterium]|nr:MAG: PAS domain S-box protein [Desulfobacteraceae bacterium]